MSSDFEGFEQDFAVLTAEITSKIARVPRLPPGESPVLLGWPAEGAGRWNAVCTRVPRRREAGVRWCWGPPAMELVTWLTSQAGLWGAVDRALLGSSPDSAAWLLAYSWECFSESYFLFCLFVWFFVCNI